jgi:hypothetical protein
MNLKKLVKEVLENKNCCTATKSTKAPILNENLASREILSEGLKYHIDNKKPLTEHVYRAGSQNYFNLWAEARALYTRGILDFSGDDLKILTETNLGEFGILEDGTKVPLDFPMEEENLTESKNDNKPIGKPMRGGPKKFYVYVRDPKTKKVKKVSFGGTTGLSVKINDPKARKSFAARHDCANKKDRTKPSYWSCNIGKYWKQLGGEKNFSGFW